MIQKQDARNQKTMYIYDDAGRPSGVSYFSSTDHINPVKIVSFTYDNLGNLMGYNDGTTSAEYQYDDAYRKLTETVDYSPFTKTFGYTYYANGAKKSFTDPSGTTYTYSYDAANQPTAVQIPGQGSITFTSYTWNRPASVTLPGGSRKDYVYDPLMRVKQITSRDPAQNVLMNYQYTYDKVDNIMTKDTEHGLYTYGYDALYRLTSADNPTLPGEAYTYDGVGNRLTSSEASDWTYNPNNELLSYNGITFAYDENGNTIQKTEGTETTYYIYNEEDRLARVEDTAHNLIAAYHYDPFGRRLWKEVAGNRTYFLYSDEGLIGEYDADRTELKTYGYKPNSTWTTDPIFLKTQGTYYFYHNDHLGTPNMITASNGVAAWSANYESFGNAGAVIPSSTLNNLRLPGQHHDQETGFSQNYFRSYNSSTGRYLTPDPIGLEGGINLFVYLTNNPINFIDPFGLIWVTIDHDYHGTKNWLKWWWNRWTTQLSKGMVPTMPGADPKEYEDLKRDVIQEWRCDPDNPERDNNHTVGAIRRITQTYKKHNPPKPGEVVIRSPNSHYWSPQLPSPTYQEFFGVRIEGDLQFFGTGAGNIP